MGKVQTEKSKPPILCMNDILGLDTAVYNGFGKLPSVPQIVQDYILRNADPRDAARSFIDSQCKKTALIGFADAIMPEQILKTSLKLKDFPADLALNLLFRIRLVQGLALMGEYNYDSDQVRTMVWTNAITASAFSEIIKQLGFKFGDMITPSIVEAIPIDSGREICAKQVDFSIGNISIVNSYGKMVLTAIEGVLSAALDGGVTYLIGQRGYQFFIEGIIPDESSDTNASIT